MPLWANLVAFAAGVLVVTKGAGWFTGGAVAIARATGVSNMFIGATLVSIATTLPEFGVSAFAAAVGRLDTSVGNAVGSTICNIGLILAIGLLIRPMPIPRAIVQKEGLIMIGAAALVILLSFSGTIGRGEGAVLLLAAVLYLWHLARRSGWGSPAANGEGAQASLAGVAGRFLAGAAAVLAGSMLLVENAAKLARAAGVPELVIAVTLVAIGTSMPELITAIVSALHGHKDIALGNVIGANVLNLTWVLGAASAIRPLPIRTQTFSLDFPAMVAVMALLLAAAAFPGPRGRWVGGAFLLAYGVYLALMFSWFA
ncbi:MAG: calcium/sodium antiporter [bacterium]|nr:calcium/sodium antiporter [bacterium]